MNDQIQYGYARSLTGSATREPRVPPPADVPTRFRVLRSPAAARGLAIAGVIAVGGLLIAVPRQVPPPTLAGVIGGAWLALVLAITLPSRNDRAREELIRRISHFRDAVNAVGDTPNRAQLDTLVQLAAQLDLNEHEIADELARVRASLDALAFMDDIATNGLPVVTIVGPASRREACHFHAPVRFGRRRSDQYGSLILTASWLKFSGTMDVSVAWSEVRRIERASADVIVKLQTGDSALRFSCRSLDEAVRAGVVAEHLRQRDHELELATGLSRDSGGDLAWT